MRPICALRCLRLAGVLAIVASSAPPPAPAKPVSAPCPSQ